LVEDLVTTAKFNQRQAARSFPGLGGEYVLAALAGQVADEEAATITMMAITAKTMRDAVDGPRRAGFWCGQLPLRDSISARS